MSHLRLSEIMSELRRGGRLSADDWALVCEMQALLFSMGESDPGTPRTSGAERQARYRKRNALRNGDVTSDVTGDGFPPKEKNQTPLPPETLRVSTPSGKRLPDDWAPLESLLSWAKAELGLAAATVTFETGAFCDHFWAMTGPRSTKRRWDLAWKNWMREAKRREKKPRDTIVDFRPGAPKPAFRAEPPKLSNEEWKKLKEKSQ
jgi:hypothetical protein